MPRVTPPDTPSGDTLTRNMTLPGDTPSETSLEALRHQLADAEKRAAVAEAELRGTRALIDEKQRTIEAQAHALRLLEPPRLSQPPQGTEPGTATQREPATPPWIAVAEETRQADPTPATPPQRSWWQRLRGT